MRISITWLALSSYSSILFSIPSLHTSSSRLPLSHFSLSSSLLSLGRISNPRERWGILSSKVERCTSNSVFPLFFPLFLSSLSFSLLFLILSLSLLGLSSLSLHQGYLLKQGGARKNWKRRWFVLERHSRLSYYDSREVFDVGAQPLNTVHTHSLLSFSLSTNTSSLSLPLHLDYGEGEFSC